MTITSQLFYQQFLTGLQQNLQAELTDTDQIASGKRLSLPSDDPSALTKVVDYQTQISEIAQYQQAMTDAKSPLQSLDTALSGLNQTLASANTLAINGANGTQNANTRLMISDQVQQLFDTAVSTANTQVDGKYIFAGYKSTTNPIDPTTGESVSDNNSVNVGIANGINITTNIAASSLFSFQRVNTTDSAVGILPAYNWANGGANTIPDADPVSALETTVPSAPIYTINQGDKITIGANTYNLTPGAYSSAAALATQLNNDTSVPASGVTFSYDAATNKIKMTAAPGTTIHWESTTLQAEQTLGFTSNGPQTIGASGYIESDNTIGNFTASDNIFTQNGGALSVNVGSNSTTSTGGFVINSSNNEINIDGAQYTIASNVYTGVGLAAALSNLVSGVTFNYSGAAHKFTIAGSGHSIDLSKSTARNIIGFDSAASQNLSTTGITSDNVLGDVNLAAGSTLQDVSDALNTTGLGVKAKVVNEGTTITPDFRLIVASDPAGSSASIDIKVLASPSLAESTILSSGGTLTGGLVSPSVVIGAGTTIGFNDATTGVNYTTPAIAAGTYTVAQLAPQVAAALNGTAFGNNFTVTANANNTLTITNNHATDNVNILWTGTGSGTAEPQQFGFAPDSSGPPAAGVNMLSYDQSTAQNMTLGTNITNYNYITQTGANDSIVIGDGTSGGIANNKIVVEETGFASQPVAIARGTYTRDQLAVAIQNALNSAANPDGANTNAYSVTFDPNAMKFKIAQTNATGVAVTFQWNSLNTTTAQLLGFSPAMTINSGIAAGGGSVQSDNSVLANYYSFNNNYLNDKYVLRALNFENQSLLNNDSGRIGQSIKYMDDLTDIVSQNQALVGARENELTAETTYQTNTSTNIQTFLSNADDTDIAKVSTDLTQRQAALTALRTISSQVLNQSLFDFLKF